MCDVLAVEQAAVAHLAGHHAVHVRHERADEEPERHEQHEEQREHEQVGDVLAAVEAADGLAPGP